MRKYLICLLGMMTMGATAQNKYVSPMDIGIFLAGNFGEPRPNHFHCGLDFRTQGAIGKKMYAVADGYVSRITVGLDGFGNALYITHYDGNTTVYCHLDRFVPQLDKAVYEYQMSQQNEVVDLRLPAVAFPVKAGQLVAYSGNTGASQGPHLHLELQREKEGLVLNPMPYFKHLIKDNLKPQVHGIRLYPAPGEGVLSGGTQVETYAPQGQVRTFPAWGKIGLAFWADDYMNGTGNKFGIYDIRLLVDGKEIFSARMDSLRQSEHRQVNSWGDYEFYRKRKVWYLKTFQDPGNDLSMIRTDPQNRGWIVVDQERVYQVTLQLTDQWGNKTVTSLRLRGKRQDALLQQIVAREQERQRQKNYVFWDRANVIQEPGMELRLPKGCLFHNALLEPQVQIKDNALSHNYQPHNEPLPLKTNATLLLAPTQPLTAQQSQYYIENKRGYVGGSWQNGWLVASIRDLDERYAIAVDTVAPVVSPIAMQRWSVLKKIRLSVADRKSGIKSFKAYLDGRFVLFTTHNGVRVCDLPHSGVLPNRSPRKLDVVVTDRCGNVQRKTIHFVY